MQRPVSCVVVCLSFLLALAGCSDQAPVEHESADRIFLGDNIVTMDESVGKVTAVAIRNDKIIWLGDRVQAKELMGKNTLVEELGERALLPGFIDAHGHFSLSLIGIDLANVASPPVGTVTDMGSLQGLLSNYISEKNIPPGEWVFGQGYDDSLLLEQRHPNRSDLDKVSTTHPIALIHVSAHLATLNSLALEKLGISADSSDPSGGHIRRIENSQQPNGVLEETAIMSVRNVLMTKNAPTADAIEKTMNLYASQGITTVQDGGLPLEFLPAMQAWADKGAFNLDLVAYQFLAPGVELIDPARVGTYRNRFKIGGVKLVLDGSPQGKTAYMTKPYLKPPHGQDADYRGYPSMPSETIQDLVKQSLSRQLPLLGHANGDAAHDVFIDAVEQANPQHDHRSVIIHAQTVREDQLDRMKELEIIPSYFSAHSFFWGDWHRDSVFGEERAMRISPARSTLERGMPFTLHNDAPIVPPDMIRLLWATTNRITRSGKVLGEAQRISTNEALRGITVNAAYQYFEEDSKGSINVGKQADLVILSANPLKMDSNDLLQLKVLETISRGQSVFLR